MAMSSQIPNSFSIITGQSSFPGQIPADPNKYLVKDDHGATLLSIGYPAGSGPGGPLLLIRDSFNTEVMKMSVGPQGVKLFAPHGPQLGNVLISAKPAKEHKKDKVKEAKKQVIFTNPTSGWVLYSLSGKMKHGGSSIEMKIKSFQNSQPTSMAHHDKKHKDKSKKIQMGEANGNLYTGTHVKLSNHAMGLGPHEKYNIIGLLIGYMEIERHSHGHNGGNGQHGAIGVGVPVQSQMHMHNPGGIPQNFHPGNPHPQQHPQMHIQGHGQLGGFGVGVGGYHPQPQVGISGIHQTPPQAHVHPQSHPQSQMGMGMGFASQSATNPGFIPQGPGAAGHQGHNYPHHH